MRPAGEDGAGSTAGAGWPSLQDMHDWGDALSSAGLRRSGDGRGAADADVRGRGDGSGTTPRACRCCRGCGTGMPPSRAPSAGAARTIDRNRLRACVVPAGQTARGRAGRGAGSSKSRQAIIDGCDNRAARVLLDDGARVGGDIGTGLVERACVQPAAECRAALAPHEWTLKRNCSMSPRQFASLIASLAIVSVGVASIFAYSGAWWILVFAFVEMAALLAAFVVYARHAGDYERIVVTPDAVIIEFNSGTEVVRQQAHPAFARVEYPYPAQAAGRRLPDRACPGRQGSGGGPVRSAAQAGEPGPGDSGASPGGAQRRLEMTVGVIRRFDSESRN